MKQAQVAPTTPGEKAQIPRPVTGQPWLTIRRSLSLAFGILSALTLLISVLAWLLYDELGSDLEVMTGVALPQVVQSRNLVMANNSLTTVANKMALATRLDELERQAQFGTLAAARIQQALLEADTGMFAADQLVLLQQINRQIDRVLQQLQQQVRSSLDLQLALHKNGRTIRQAGDRAARQIAKKIAALSSSGGMTEVGLYVASLNLIREAEWYLHVFEQLDSQVEFEQLQADFQQTRARFWSLGRKFAERGLENYHLDALNAEGWKEGGLFSLQGELLESRAQIQALLASSNQLSAQFRLLTTAGVNRSSEQVQSVREEAREDIVQRKLLMVVLMVACLGISAGLVWFFGHRRMAKPLESLALAVKALEQGELGTFTTKPGILEIDNLTLSFKRMAETIAARDHELRQLQLLLRNVVDSLSVVLLAVDQDCRLTLWNLRAEECCEKSALTVATPVAVLLDWLPLDLGAVEQAVRNGEVLLLKNLPVERPEGARIYELHCSPLVGAETPGAVLRLEDVTERLRIEKTVAQSEKMMSVGGLAAGIAHEINNPLAGILQSVQVLYNRFNPEMPKNRQVASSCGIDLALLDCYLQQRGIAKMLGGIRTSANQAAQIVKNMLAFSRTGPRLEGGDFQLHDLAALVESTVALLATDYDLSYGYDFRQIHIERKFPENLAPIYCEGALVQQVVFNILKNSAQALSAMEGGQRAPCIELKLYPQGEYLLLEIRDNGPGMAAEVRSRIFEPFYTTKATGRGTGLGLSVSYFIIAEYHRGTIAVESEPGQGCCFKIGLPIEKRQPR